MPNKKPKQLQDRDYLIKKQFPDRCYLVNSMPISSSNYLSEEALRRLDRINMLVTEIIDKIRPKKEGPYVRAIKYDPIQKKVIKIINPAEPLIKYE